MKSDSNVFKRLLRSVPGYRGYAERQSQRRSDTRLRARVALAVTRCERTVEDRIQREMSQSGEASAGLEKCRKAIDTLAERIRYAPLGHSGLTSDRGLTENDLQEIMGHDLELMEAAEDLESRVMNMAEAEIMAAVERMRRTLDERNDFIREFN